MKVLVVEDDQDTADFVAKGLEQAGHNVTTACNGADGLFYVLDGQFDAVVLDRMLPGMDGIELIEAMRSGGCSVPTLMLTARAGLEDRVAGLNAGG